MLKRGHALFSELEERARFRRELNASDLPDGMKTVLGFLADPVGAAVDAAAKEMARRQKEREEP